MSIIKKLILFALVSISGEYRRAKFYGKFLGVKFGNNVRITGKVHFGSEPFLITVGNDVTLTAGVTFHNHDGGVGVLRKKYPGIDVIKPIVIGNNVFIGSHVTIMPGVIIGNNVVIGASSVVSRNIPDNVVVVGVPARILKTLEEYENKVLKQAIFLKNRNDLGLRKAEILKELQL